MSNLIEQSRERKIRRWFVYSLSTLFVIIISALLLYGLRPLILPFLTGAFFAYLFKPLAKSFQTSNWKGTFKLISFLGVTAFSLYGLTVMVTQALPTDPEKAVLKVRLQYRLNERFESWMGLENNGKGNFVFENVGQELEPLMSQLNHHLELTDKEKTLFFLHQEKLGPESAEAQKYALYYKENLKDQHDDQAKLQEALAAPAALEKKQTSKFFSNLLKTVSNWIIFPLVFIFILLDAGQILHFFMALVPNRYFELTYSVIKNVDEALGKYIRGTLIECALVGISLTLGFYLCGLELQVAFLIGVIGGLTNAIPFLGTAIACALSGGYSLIAENVQPLIPFVNANNLMLAVIAVVLVVHMLDNAIFQPLVVGKAVNLHPLVVVIGVFGSSMIFGFAGLIFAIPTIVVAKVVVQTFFSGLQRYKII